MSTNGISIQVYFEPADPVNVPLLTIHGGISDDSWDAEVAMKKTMPGIRLRDYYGCSPQARLPTSLRHALHELKRIILKSTISMLEEGLLSR